MCLLCSRNVFNHRLHKFQVQCKEEMDVVHKDLGVDGMRRENRVEGMYHARVAGYNSSECGCALEVSEEAQV